MITIGNWQPSTYAGVCSACFKGERQVKAVTIKAHPRAKQIIKFHLCADCGESLKEGFA